KTGVKILQRFTLHTPTPFVNGGTSVLPSVRSPNPHRHQVSPFPLTHLTRSSKRSPIPLLHPVLSPMKRLHHHPNPNCKFPQLKSHLKLLPRRAIAFLSKK
ncbi:hypothetical protein QUA03_27445, partial [Microcoleus sp. S36b_A4]|uniref:hypothetical protein n=1 Tax=Microcoleus sp. S36b_A4 TaxID=3055420 RepID=UPI002FCF4E3F